MQREQFLRGEKFSCSKAHPHYKQTVFVVWVLYGCSMGVVWALIKRHEMCFFVTVHHYDVELQQSSQISIYFMLNWTILYKMNIMLF